MYGMTKVLLRDLELRHHGCFLHRAKQWTKWFARLKIDRTVLYLDDHIVSELSIEMNEFIVGLFCTVFIIRAINKRAPHNESAIFTHCIGQHIGAISMRSS